MSKKKLIFSLVVTSFSIVFYGTVNLANASSLVEVCRLDAKIVNVTEGHVFVDITGIKIYNMSSTLCADINKNIDYKITRDNFLKNAYRESIFVGQNIIIDGVSGNAMGPDGPVYWDSWELESAGGKAIKLPITLEKVSVNVTVGDTDSLIGGNTYTIAELNTNTSTTLRKFFTEAYVVRLPTGEYNPEFPGMGWPFLVISDSKQFEVKFPLCSPNTPCPPILTEKQMKLDVVNGNTRLVELDRKYRFEVNVRNTSNTNVTKNEFTLVSIKNIDGSVVASETTTPLITDQPAKRSFFGRIWSWFAGLFKR